MFAYDAIVERKFLISTSVARANEGEKGNR